MRNAPRPAVQLCSSVQVGEERTLTRDPVDVGRLVAHLAQVVGADIPEPDVIAPDDQDIRLAAGSSVLGAAAFLAGFWACATGAKISECDKNAHGCVLGMGNSMYAVNELRSEGEG